MSTRKRIEEVDEAFSELIRDIEGSKVSIQSLGALAMLREQETKLSSLLRKKDGGKVKIYKEAQKLAALSLFVLETLNNEEKK